MYATMAVEMILKICKTKLERKYFEFILQNVN